MANDLLLKIPGFDVNGVINAGGMATVYSAMQLDLHRPVAVKVMKQELTQDESFHQRFLLEARTLARIKHPNIIQVFTSGTAGKDLYIVLEYADGGSLEDRLLIKDEKGVPERRRLDKQDALQVLESVASALAAVHERGIIHRDVKPANILFQKDGTSLGIPMLTDFGIVKPTDTNADLTSIRALIGTAGYMSPEQAMSWPVTAQSDIYSLGVVFFRSLTGYLPNRKDVSLPEGSQDCAVLLNKMLAQDPDDRFSSAQELATVAKDMRQMSRRLPRPRAADSTRVEELPPQPVSAGSSSSRAVAPEAAASTVVTVRTGRKRTLLTVAAISVVVLGVLAIFFRPVDDGVAPRSLLSLGTETIRTLDTMYAERLVALEAASQIYAQLWDGDPGAAQTARDLSTRYQRLATSAWLEIGPAPALNIVEQGLKAIPAAGAGELKKLELRLGRVLAGDIPPPEPGRVPELIAAAQRSAKQLQFADAVAAYKEILMLDPDHPAAREQLGGIAAVFEQSARQSFQAGQTRDSVVSLEQGLYVQPDHAGLLALKRDIESGR